MDGALRQWPGPACAVAVSFEQLCRKCKFLFGRRWLALQAANLCFFFSAWCLALCVAGVAAFGGDGQAEASSAGSVIPPQKQMTGMLGHPVAENPIDRMFDAVYAHYGLPWQFWKSDIANPADLALAVAALAPLGYRGVGITVPYKVAVIPLLDAVDDDVRAIGAANYLTIEQGRLIGHNNDGKGVVKAIEKVAPLQGQRVVMGGG